MFNFRFAVVYRPIYAPGSILNLVFFFFQYYIFGYRMNLVVFWLCFAIIYINHGRIGINTAFWGWLWPDIPSRDPQIITSNLRFSVIIWRSLDGISGHNHHKCSIYSLSIQLHWYFKSMLTWRIHWFVEICVTIAHRFLWMKLLIIDNSG